MITVKTFLDGPSFAGMLRTFFIHLFTEIGATLLEENLNLRITSLIKILTKLFNST